VAAALINLFNIFYLTSFPVSKQLCEAAEEVNFRRAGLSARTNQVIIRSEKKEINGINQSE
jgi:hypothetical protein